MHILLVEDERKIATFVRRALEEQGFTVEYVADGDEAYVRAHGGQYDLIVLDIMIPGRDGLSILRSLRDERNAVPVVLLTARGALDERLHGLNIGADDYVTKPFFIEELVARVHAVIRRSSGESLSVLQADDLTVNLITREVTRGGQPIELTVREFSLLEFLMRAPGRVLPRTQILEHVWGYDFDPCSNLVDVYVQRVRKKLSPRGEPQLIDTVRGVGYRFRSTRGSAP
ncbi:response regulator transcription factor [bacterium]|nr:response regulator transcription factor [bacterium]